MPAASQTPTAVPADTLDCLQDCSSVYMYTPFRPLPSQYCYALAPTKLISAVLRPRVHGLAHPGPLQSCHTPVELERCSPKFRRYGQSKTKRHSNACLHRVRDRALVLCEGVTTLVSFPHIRRHMISVFLPWTLIHKPAQRPIFWSKQSSSRPPASINRSICDDIASKVSVCTPLLDDLTDPEQQTSSQHHDELRTWKISSRSVTGYTSDLPVLRALHGIPDASFALRRYRRA
jgi:hypothetical protein